MTSSSIVEIHRDGKYTTLDDTNGGTGPAPGAVLIGINHPGVMTGICWESNSASLGFIELAGRFITINAPGASTGEFQGTQFYGLNDIGMIAGVYFDSSGAGHGFVYVAGTFMPVNDSERHRIGPRRGHLVIRGFFGCLYKHPRQNRGR